MQKESGGCTTVVPNNVRPAQNVRPAPVVRPAQTGRPAVPVIVATLQTPLDQDKKQCIIS